MQSLLLNQFDNLIVRFAVLLHTIIQIECHYDRVALTTPICNELEHAQLEPIMNRLDNLHDIPLNACTCSYIPAANLMPVIQIDVVKFLILPYVQHAIIIFKFYELHTINLCLLYASNIVIKV